MGPLHVLLMIAWFISGLGSAGCVLLHSGDGDGVVGADSLRSANETTSAGVVEKNLDRLTIMCVIGFVVTLILMVIFWPQVPVSQTITVNPTS